MIQDKYLLKSDQNLYREQNCNDILAYLKTRRRIYEWYGEVGFIFPHESENNFRDSWYHYKKLYIDHSTYEVISQTANLKEHIQRAEKDAVVKLFQEVCSGLEVWMERSKSISLSTAEKDEYKQALDVYDQFCQNEIKMVKELEVTANNLVSDKATEEEKRSCFWEICAYVFDKKIAGKSFYKKSQQLLHRIKALLLQIRSGGTEIARVDVPGQCCQKMETLYNELMFFLQEHHFQEIFVMVTAYVAECE